MKTIQELYLEGTCYWAKHAKPDEKYKNYEIDFYPTETDLTRLINAGFQGKVRESEHGKWVKIRKPSRRITKNDEIKKLPPPELYDRDNNKIEDPAEVMIGNGSEITVKLHLIPDEKGDMITRWVALRVNNNRSVVEVKRDEDYEEVPF